MFTFLENISNYEFAQILDGCFAPLSMTALSVPVQSSGPVILGASALLSTGLRVAEAKDPVHELVY